MSRLSAFKVFIGRLIHIDPSIQPPSPAQVLMEAADVRTGLDAQHAQELRVAATAYLSVIR
ncbi:conserved hypothetical protein [Burkholderiales bacterium 8X]|nr:conserved hypothetical protein [Burkholderiales bacterium 8X]